MTKKHDPITIVPETLTAPWIKRFFKEFFDISVRVSRANSGSFVRVWILWDNADKITKKMTWSRLFPEELGNRCMRIVYPGSPMLREQNWGGNIQSNGISMLGSQFRRLLCDLVAERKVECCD